MIPEKETAKKRKIAILGSTGSIGRQALDVISRHEDVFSVELLTANDNADLLIKQAIRFNPNWVVIANHTLLDKVKSALYNYDIKVFAGIESICDILRNSTGIDIVLSAIVGFNGLLPTIESIRAGRTVALANKETLVAGGPVISQLLTDNPESYLIPVDSEHSAIFQCLKGEQAKIEKIILTASGGPFLNISMDNMKNISVEEALNHPKWSMGAKVSIDSASMMNKGLEMIEAHWLFNVKPENIEIVIHPQSVIHSMVQFSDGSVSAQLSWPDMRIPIQYALSYPYRIDLDSRRLNFTDMRELTFIKPDRERFPAIDIAYSAIKVGGNIPCAMNAANEIAVEAFLSERLPFCKIPEIINKTISKCNFVKNPDLDTILGTDCEAKKYANEIVKKI